MEDTPADAAARPTVEVATQPLNDPASEQEAPPAALPVEQAEPQAPATAVPAFLTRIQIRGFVSEGGYISTENDYIGGSDQGSLKLFEAGINFSTELTDQLRVGVQFVSRSVGTLSEEIPRLDWAVIDYRHRPWLGLRAGVIKMPFGLYNEYVSIDTARTSILLPQSVYPLRNRDALVSHTGFALYGNAGLGALGDLDYEGWLGKLSVPRSALELGGGAQLDSVDTRYVAGGKLFWSPPVEGLRLGGSYLRTTVDFNISLPQSVVDQLVAAEAVAADYDGKLKVSQDPGSFWIASAEYIQGSWLFAAEYSRFYKHQYATIPLLSPTLKEESERFYGMASYRPSRYVELGTYYSVTYTEVEDRKGSGARFKYRYQAFQRDLAATIRLDVNEYWLWKLEGHFMDGAADLPGLTNPEPKRYWGLFLFRTTVTF